MISALTNIGYRVWVGAALLFLPAPIIIVAVSSFSATRYLQFPPRELSLRWYQAFLTDDVWMTALGASVLIALFSAIVTTVVIFLAALAITRLAFPGRRTFEFLLLSPLLLPNAAIGVIFLTMLSSVGWVGYYQGIVFAHIILCIPFAFRPLVVAMRKMDLAVEEAAMTLGATPLYVFRTVTLPMLRPAIAAALLFSFIISFDEGTVTLFLVGPNAMTLPAKTFTFIQESNSPVVAAVSTFLIALTAIFIFVLQRFGALNFYVASEKR